MPTGFLWPSLARNTSTKLLTMHSSIELARIHLRWCMGTRRVGRFAGLAAGNEVLLPDALSHLRKRKSVQPAAHVAAQIAIGEAAYKERIERGARDHAKLAESGDASGEAPIRHAYTHSALNDLGKLDHL